MEVEKVDVSLDNVTYMGHLRCHKDELREMLEDWAYDAAFEADRRSTLAKKTVAPAVRELRYIGFKPGEGAWVWLIDGAHLQIPIVENEFFTGCSEDTERFVRLELNPNKLTDRILSVLTLIQVDHVSRVDVALDYYGLDVSSVTAVRPRVKSVTWSGKSCGGVESLYLGRQASERFVRIYDKALELGGVSGALTRVEGVGRARKVLDRGLFSGLEVYERQIPDDISDHLAGLCAIKLWAPERWAQVDKRSKRQVLDVLRDQRAIAPMPQDVYESRRDDLVSWVSSLSDGVRPPVAGVYQLATEDKE